MDDKSSKPRFRPRREGSRPPPAGEKTGKPRARDIGREAPRAEEGERIAKRLARAGIASRREAEGLIADGRIRVNGRVLASPAVNVSAHDRIELDGHPIPAPERTRLFLLHKPSGVVTTSRDPEGRRTVFDVLPEGLPRLITVGRLDINTEGLLLLTNDGGLARVLELPSTGWLRRYRVRVHGEVDEGKLAALGEGTAVDGIFYGPIEASLERRQGTNAWLSLGLREGKNREVKNVLGALGLEVTRLIRVSFGPFQLGELAEGHVQEIKGRTLRDQLGERLIEAAGADFEAEIAQPFANKPVRREEEAGSDAAERRPRGERVSREEPAVENNGLIRRSGRRDRGEWRESALSRLQTSRPGRDEPKRLRSSNVWMAPGARPEGKLKPLKDKGKTSSAAGRTQDRIRREPGRDEQESGRSERRHDGPRPDRPMRRPERALGGAEARGDFRGEGPARAEARPKPPSITFRERDGEARPPRREGPARDPRRPFKPRGERPPGDRPPRDAADGTARPRPDRPRFERPRQETVAPEDRRSAERPFKPRGERKNATGERPTGKGRERNGDQPGRSRNGPPKPRGAGPQRGSKGPPRGGPKRS